MQQTTILGFRNREEKHLLEQEVFSITKNFQKLFETKLNAPMTIRLHFSRKSFDKQLGRHTQEWEVGNISQENTLNIFHPDAMEKYSTHNRAEFTSILKHEIAHIFISHPARGKTVPLWLNEGLAMYLAGQVQDYSSSANYYIEKSFYEKISTQQGWDKHANYEAYKYACLFVYFLIKRYSIKTLLTLLKKLDRIYYPPNFDKTFQQVFKIKLSKAETDFIKSLNLNSID
ncbi:MAG: hypothetical protein Q8P73_04685 [bacterium]|nr:hypothetical protein [bacterium]